MCCLKKEKESSPALQACPPPCTQKSTRWGLHDFRGSSTSVCNLSFIQKRVVGILVSLGKEAPGACMTTFLHLQGGSGVKEQRQVQTSGAGERQCFGFSVHMNTFGSAMAQRQDCFQVCPWVQGPRTCKKQWWTLVPLESHYFSLAICQQTRPSARPGSLLETWTRGAHGMRICISPRFPGHSCTYCNLRSSALQDPKHLDQLILNRSCTLELWEGDRELLKVVHVSPSCKMLLQ